MKFNFLNKDYKVDEVVSEWRESNEEGVFIVFKVKAQGKTFYIYCNEETEDIIIKKGDNFV
jgi:hypothetical protein